MPSPNCSDPSRSPEKSKLKPPRTPHKKWSEERPKANKLLDEPSKDNDSSSLKSSSTPSGIVVSGSALVRDLSDLSGSYLNGNTTTPSRGAGVPRNVYQSDQSASSCNRPWRQAKLLSSREPQHPQPKQDLDDSFGEDNRNAMVVVGCNGVVEVVEDGEELPANFVELEEYPHRMPLLVLLMDPGRKIYELMQLWIDVKMDTVRDVLHAIQHGIADKWRQDYDGLFQVRNSSFSQLIHILNVSKYEVQPYELWVAKPWSMSTKSTVGYAGTLLNHLRNIGILTLIFSSDNTSARRKAARSPRNDDTILVLSKEAHSRIYHKTEILKHHHAFQFLSFSPSFEPMVRVDVLGADADDASASQLSDSNKGSANDSEKKEDKLGPFPSVLSIKIPKGPSAVKNVDPPSTPPHKPTSTGCCPGRRVSDSNLSQTQSVKQKREPSPPPPPPPPPPPSLPPLPLPPFSSSTPEPRGILRVLSALNCAKCLQKHMDTRYQAGQDLETTDALMESTAVGTMWKVCEEETESYTENVDLSDSAPLLYVRPERSDWFAEV